MAQPRSQKAFLRKSFRFQATRCGAIDEDLEIVYILEFKRSTDDEGLLEVKEAEANEQHKSIIAALRAATPKWEFEQINFVVGNCGLVVESDFYTKLKKLDVHEGKKDKLFADHVTQVFLHTLQLTALLLKSFRLRLHCYTLPTVLYQLPATLHNLASKNSSLSTNLKVLRLLWEKFGNSKWLCCRSAFG